MVKRFIEVIPYAKIKVDTTLGCIHPPSRSFTWTDMFKVSSRILICYGLEILHINNV